MIDNCVLVNHWKFFIGDSKDIPKLSQFLHELYIMEQRSFALIHHDDEGKTYFDTELVASIIDSTRNDQVISDLKEADIINAIDSSGNTLLHIAAQHDNDVITQHLIRSECKIDAQNQSGKTPLILAIENRCQNSTGILLEANANTLITDSEGKSALHYFLDAQWFNVFDLVWTFLKKVESQCLNNTEVIATKLMDAEWPLPCCRLLENIEVTKAMLQHGCQVDAREPGINRTALHEAGLSSDVALVKLLLDHGADPNAMDRFLRAPLHYVYDRERKHTDERLEIVKLLIGKGALTVTSADESSWSQVDLLLRYGNSEVIQILLDANLDLGRDDDDYNTPVHIIAANRYPDAFEALKDRSFELEVQNSYVETPLWIAAAHGNACAVKILLEKGADVNADNNQSCLPLHKCIEQFSPEYESQYLECVQLLLEYGAEFQDEFYIDEEPYTVYDVVEERQIYNVGELLIAHLVLQETRGMPIDVLIHHSIQSHSTFETYYNFCKLQLAATIFKSLTLLDLLNASIVKFESYARDQQCVSSIENFNKEWQLKLYYYNTILQKRFSKTVQMLKLKKEAAIHICKIMKTEYLRFPLIADQIVNYLDETDLRNLLQVSL